MLIYLFFISSMFIADIGNGQELIGWYNPHHDIVVLRFADGTETTVEACKYDSRICECSDVRSWEDSIKKEVETSVKKYYKELNRDI